MIAPTPAAVYVVPRSSLHPFVNGVELDPADRCALPPPVRAWLEQTLARAPRDVAVIVTHGGGNPLLRSILAERVYDPLAP